MASYKSSEPKTTPISHGATAFHYFLFLQDVESESKPPQGELGRKRSSTQVFGSYRWIPLCWLRPPAPRQLLFRLGSGGWEVFRELPTTTGLRTHHTLSESNLLYTPTSIIVHIMITSKFTSTAPPFPLSCSAVHVTASVPSTLGCCKALYTRYVQHNTVTLRSPPTSSLSSTLHTRGAPLPSPSCQP